MNYLYAFVGAFLGIIGFIIGVLISEWTSRSKFEFGGIIRSAEVQRIKEGLKHQENTQRDVGAWCHCDEHNIDYPCRDGCSKLVDV